MSQGRRLAVPFLLAFLMVMLPLSQVDFSDKIEVEEIVDIRINESPSNNLNLSEPYSIDTFVDQSIFYDSKRAESVSVGWKHSCIVYDEGSLTCSGYNYQGMLGVGYDTSSPYIEKEHLDIKFPESVSISEVEVGYDSTCAIDDNGKLWCWGYNEYGKSGTGISDNYLMTPNLVQIDENESITEVAVGNDHKCALTETNRVYCWGNNNYGQALLSHTGSVNTPYLVEFDDEIIPVSISGKYDHTCILNYNGAVYCWGYNGYGQLGDGTQTNRYEIVQSILPSSDPAVKVVAGYYHTCALLESGEMRCWGRNNLGQIGVESNTPNQYNYPTPVLNLPADPLSFDLGYEYTCALLKTQTSLCWGKNDHGQLGDGTSTGFQTNGFNGKHRPVTTYWNSEYFENSLELSIGYYTSCSIFDTGRVACWGYNGQGQIGDGTQSSRYHPHYNKVTVGLETSNLLFPINKQHRISPYVDGLNYSVTISPELPTGFTFEDSTGAIVNDGSAELNTTHHNLTFTAGEDIVTIPVSITVRESLPFPSRVRSHLSGITLLDNENYGGVVSLTSTKDHTCINQESGIIHCWGDGQFGKLSTNSNNDENIPKQTSSNSAYNAIRDTYFVATATEHTCALTNYNDVYCWGEAEDYRLGHGSTTDSLVPVEVPFPNHRSVEMIATHSSHNCALMDNGAVYCWGNNTDGQIGIGYKSGYSYYPASSHLPHGSMAVAISVGDSFSCAVLSNGTITCWGGNDLGQLGDGTNSNTTSPTTFVTLGQNAISVSSGDSHSCAVMQDGRVACWGNNDYGQLGDGTLVDKKSPVYAQLPNSKSAVMIDVGISHTCAVMDDGTLYCWGLNANYQLGDGTNTFRSTPIASNLPNGMSASLVTTGEGHTCILTNASTIYCMGANSDGQLGDSTTVSRNSFTETNWNRNNSVSSIYLTTGFSAESKLSISGWGAEYSLSSSNLPSSLAIVPASKTIAYDGINQVNTNMTVYASDENNNISIELDVESFVHDQIEGRINSFSLQSGFTQGDFIEDIEVNAGFHHSCLKDNYKLRCWGFNQHGEMGRGNTGTYQRHAEDVYSGEMKSVQKYDTGTYTNCAIDNSSQLWCWGYNHVGQLGLGDTSNRPYPTKVSSIDKVLDVSVSWEHVCALTIGWDAYCWGENSYGQSGTNSNVGTHQYTPQEVTGFDSRITMVTAGRYFGCVLLENGTVGCFGWANYGAMGDGSNQETGSDIRWPALPQNRHVVALDAGWNHACAIMDDNSLYCWGHNSYGQVGNGNTTDIFTPIEILDSSYDVVGVTTGAQTTCSWLRNGSGLCWGYNQYGQLGNGNNTDMSTPVWIRPHSMNENMEIVTLDVESTETCALYDNQALSCWGMAQSYYGLGHGGQTDTNVPNYFIYNPYTGTRYDGTGEVLTDLSFIEGYAREEKLQNIGWNSRVSVSGSLPNGLSFNSTTNILSYDGSQMLPGQFTLQITDDFGSRNLQVSYSSINTNDKEGRVDGAWLGNASFNSENNDDYQQVISIDNDNAHTCMLELDGDVHCWGHNNYYQLGDGSNSDRNRPTETNADNYHPNINITQISVGASHTCALDSNSELLCWGNEGNYRLANGQPSGSTSYPYKYTSQSEVYGKQLATVSAGGEHTCAIRYDAQTWCWGMGNYGQIGDGVVHSSGIMPKIVEFPNNESAVSLSLGYSHTCAIVENGDVYCWGRNHIGQLGVGNTTDQYYPTKVLLPSGRTATAIEAGAYHTCAILDDNSINCWGQNTNGQIGDGTTDYRDSPASVILAGLSDPIQISAGQSSTCALFDNGRLKCWGSNSNGELGIGNNNQKDTPQDLNSISHLHASHVTVGNGFTCATFHDGAPRCWGTGSNGRLGTSSSSSSNLPLPIREYSSEVITLIEGREASIPLTVAGWDYSTSLSSQLPIGITWNNFTESVEIDSTLAVGNYTITIQVSNGQSSVSASVELTVIERIDKWNDRVESHSLGMSVLSKEKMIPVDFSVGRLHTCMITTESNYCTGYNALGQLGVGSYSDKAEPTQISNLNTPLYSISTGYEHTCGIDVDGVLYCWGMNNQGQTGTGSHHSGSKHATPQEISRDYSSNELPPAMQVSTGYYHSCGIFEDMNTYCWGYNQYGQLGTGDQTVRNRPILVQSPENQHFTDLSLGKSHTCGILENGSVYCWGINNYGQLGDGSTTNNLTPVFTKLPLGSKAIAISSGFDHNCVILDNSSVYCWGYNGYGNLGNGNGTTMYTPTYVNMPTGSDTVQVSASERHTCGLLRNGSLYCWGYNNYQQSEGPVTDDYGGQIYNPNFVKTKFGQKVVSMGVGVDYTCVVTEYAAISCWGASSYARNLEVNMDKTSKLRYVITEDYEYTIQPMGWNIDDFYFSNLPSGFIMNDSELSITSVANQSGQFDWSVNTSNGMTSGSIDYEAMTIDRKYGSNSAWTNSIAYKESDSAVAMVGVDSWYNHVCSIDQNGKTYCWGNNNEGKLGDLSTNRRSSPNPVRFSGDEPFAVQVSTSYYNTCILTDEGRVMCWGDGSKGQNGQGTWDTDSGRYDLKSPGEVLLPWTSNAVMISTGREFACSLLDDGSVYCWGNNNYGQLGDGTTTYSGLPREVLLPSDRFAISIDSGDYHTCAVLDNGEMYCWGRQNYGNMGTGKGSIASNNVDYRIKIPIKIEIPLDKSVSFMAVGEYHGCAVMTDNSLWCWGYNNHGEIGLGNESSSTTEIIRRPTEIDMQFYNPIIAIDLGPESTCTLHDDGQLNCWGENEYGEVGNGLIGGDTSSPVPIQLDSGVTATGITSGDHFKCATTSDGSIQCWGYNGNSELGDGTQEPSAYPQVVDIDLPTTTSTLTYLEGEIKQNENFVSGWNYTFSISPPLPQGFELNEETGAIMSVGNSTFGVSRHDVTATAGQYTATVEVTIAVIRDTDGDGTPDTEDYDDDDDGNLDSLDNCPSQAGTSTLGGYVGCPDADGDGWADLIDPFDDDITQWKDTDGDGYGDNPNGTTPDIWILDSSQWFDTDGDGYGDNEFGTRGDSCPNEEGYSTKDVYGCLDSDSDGWSNLGDAFPQTASQFSDRDGDGWGDNQSEGAELVDLFPSDGTQWNDTDGDGHGDNKYGTEGDWFPNDPDRWADTDRDGVADEDDAFVNDATQSSDRDGDLWGDDPLGNRADEFPDDPTEWKDTDGDGVGNNADAFPFDPTQTTDRDGDGYGDNPLGAGADVFPDNPTQWEDNDEDGLGDNQSGTEADPFLSDFDNDGYNDSIDVLPKLYSPGDLDNDGYLDDVDWAPSDPREWSDFDGDGKGDNEDPDDDNDGYADTDELRQKTDPFDATSVPIESFEIVIPGTNVGLGAWDLIGIFGGVPLFAWIGFGFVTRNKRCQKYEVLLKECRSREELEQVALRWEYSLMLRMLGPHQGIRLERLRSELDDVFEKHEMMFEVTGEDQTAYVEKEIPEIQNTVEQSGVAAAQTQDYHQQIVESNNYPAQNVVTENQPVAVEQSVVEPVQNVAPSHPDSALQGTDGGDGYEWLTYNDSNYYRLSNSGSEWTLWQG